MTTNDLDDVAENIRILVREELEAGHWLVGHARLLPDCPVCQSRQPGDPRGASMTHR